MTSLKLPNSVDMPMIALGTWNTTPEETSRAIRAAIEAGYRHIDTATMYENEKEIGDALHDLYKEGIIRREDIFLTTKLWMTDMHPEDVREAFMQSMKNLRTDYVDLYLVHLPIAMVKGKGLWPQDEDKKFLYNDDVCYVDTWKEVEKLQKEGLARNIGVSNCNDYQIKKIMRECSVKPAVHQTESHPYLTIVDHAKFCKENGIVLTAYAVLGSPGRFWAADGDPSVLKDETINSIAERHGKTPAQIAIRFQIQRGVTALAKSVNPERIKSNFQVFDFELTEKEMDDIYGLNRDWRGFSLDWLCKGSKYWAFRPNYSED